MSPSRCAACRIDRRSDIFARRHRALRDAHRRAALRGRERLLDAGEGAQRRDPAALDLQPAHPRGLERIVLKALAKDVEDRYQYAIDLHDDLQSFLYTIGEFYSRKDLAAWMKKMFAAEIEEDQAKLSSTGRCRSRRWRPAAAVSPRRQSPSHHDGHGLRAGSAGAARRPPPRPSAQRPALSSDPAAPAGARPVAGPSVGAESRGRFGAAPVGAARRRAASRPGRTQRRAGRRRRHGVGRRGAGHQHLRPSPRGRGGLRRR